MFALVGALASRLSTRTFPDPFPDYGYFRWPSADLRPRNLGIGQGHWALQRRIANCEFFRLAQ